MMLALSYCTDGRNQPDMRMVSFGGGRGHLPNLECRIYAERTQNAEPRLPNRKQNHRNKQNPLPLLRANCKQANLGLV